MPPINDPKKAVSATVVTPTGPPRPGVKPEHQNARNSLQSNSSQPRRTTHDHKTTQTPSLAQLQDSVTSIHMESKELKRYRKSIRPGANIKMKSAPSIPFIRLKSDVDLEDEGIYYKADYPYKTQQHMVKLMGSTRVKLNNIEYNAALQHNMQELEGHAYKLNQKQRIKQEDERMKKLIIAGDISSDEEIFDQYKEATNNPQYRATKLLRRLEKYNDENYGSQITPPKKKIIVREPYEFDGDKYFKHMHRTGRTDWVPLEIRKQGNKKHASLLPHRTRTLLKTIFKPESHVDGGSVTEISAMTEYIDLDEYSAAEGASDARVMSITDQSRSRSQSGKKSGGVLDTSKAKLKKSLRDEILANEETRRKALRKLQKRRDKLSKEYGLEILPSETPASSILTLTSEMFQMDDLVNYENESGIDVNQYTPAKDPILDKYINPAVTAEELYGNAEALTKLYKREEIFVNNFSSKLQRQIRFI